MTATDRFAADVPGVRIQDVLEILPPHQLRDLVGGEVLGALQLLKGEAAARDPSIVESLLDFEAIIESPELLTSFLSCLPQHKVAELARRLDADPLAPDTVENKDLRRGIAAFFGRQLDFEQRESAKPHLVECEADYPLFPHQRDVCLKAIDSLSRSRSPRPAVLLHMPTGSGKTRTAAHIVSRHLAAVQQGVVIWYANTQELLEQAASELETAWSHLGDRPLNVVRFWGASSSLPENLQDGIVVAGLQKMWALIDRDPASLTHLAGHVSMVIVDEAHISLADTYRSSIDFSRRRPGVGLLGLTATPGRTWNDPTTDAALSEMYGGNKITLEVAGYENPVEYLMSSGYLARPQFEPIDVAGNPLELAFDPASLTWDADYPNELLSQIAESSAYLNGVTLAVHRLVEAGHERIIVFASSVRQSEQLASLLRATQVEADTVTGETAPARRSGAIQRFKVRGGRPRALINFGVLTTGFDAPATSAAVIARPTRSLVLYSQMVGRSIRGRKAGGNDEARILTVVDTELPGFGSVAAAFQNWEDVW